MREHNDYVNIVKDRLKRYNSYKILVGNIDNEIANIDSKLAGEAAPIAKYGDAPAGGGSDLNSTERAVETRLNLEMRRTRALADKSEILAMCHQIDHAMLGLTEIERSLVTEFYFQNKTWLEIAYAHNYAPDWARQKNAKAVKKLTEMIFGRRAILEQGRFLFIA